MPDGARLRSLGQRRLKDLAPRRYSTSLIRLPSGFPPLRSLDALPVALSSFVDPERKLAQLGRLLADERLVTMTGAGG
jgi:hypothetical protein